VFAGILDQAGNGILAIQCKNAIARAFASLEDLANLAHQENIISLNSLLMPLISLNMLN
jgi:hypothetical protein